MSSQDRPVCRTWLNQALGRIAAEIQRSADTHLIKLELPAFPGIDLYFKDESVHPSGSLKHRLARSLFLFALCNGWIREGTPVIEASSGSTAVSEAYFAKLLGLPFTAVMPKTTSAQKIAWIEFYGGRCHLVDDPCHIYAESRRLADQSGGHFMDQFANAERATDWRGNNNIAESIFGQLTRERHPAPAWVVVGAGTGGTSATIGRFIRYRSLATRLCVVDPDHSVFHDFFQSGDTALTRDCPSAIEGIGRPRVEASFLPHVIDRMIHVPDADSFAAIHLLERLLGSKCGGSTGTNFCGALQLMEEMRSRGEAGSVVTLICDRGDRYLDTYYNPDWLTEQGYDIAPRLDGLRSRTGSA